MSTVTVTKIICDRCKNEIDIKKGEYAKLVFKQKVTWIIGGGYDDIIYELCHGCRNLLGKFLINKMGDE